MTQAEIRNKLRELKDEAVALHLKLTNVNLQLQTLRKQCLHPQAKKYSRWGGRDEGKKCPDCDLDFE